MINPGLPNTFNFFPSISYIKPQPEKPGKILWVSGPPGAGKSTTCQLIARENNYAYYEADCMMPIMGLVNPFTDIHVDNPTKASMKNKPLKVQYNINYI